MALQPTTASLKFELLFIISHHKTYQFQPIFSENAVTLIQYC